MSRKKPERSPRDRARARQPCLSARHVARRRESASGIGRDCRAHRAERLRQVDAAESVIGLVVPSRGRVRFDGSSCTPSNALELRRRVGYVIQDGGLFPHLTAVDNVALVARHLRRDAAMDRRARRRARRAGAAAREVLHAISRRTLGRAAPARQPDARADARPRGAAARRAAGRARSDRAPRAAGRAARARSRACARPWCS